MMDYPFVVYQAVNQVNGKRYIGITGRGYRKRVNWHLWAAHSGKGRLLGAAIRKYGDSNIVFSPLIVCPTFRYAKEMEIAAIDVFCPEYNLTKGGDGIVGFKWSDDARAQISQRNIGNKNWLGKKHNPESIEKIRLSRLSGKGGPKPGVRYMSDEHYERVALIGKTRMLGKQYMLGRTHSLEAIERMRAAHARGVGKKVICVETGEVFVSVCDTARKVKCDHRWLRRRIKGGKKLRGFTYRFVDN